VIITGEAPGEQLCWSEPWTGFPARTGVTSRWARSTAGSNRASAARTARSAQSGFGRATWRRSTVTSWRSIMISAFLDAWLRPSSARQPKTRIMIR
jgi:hypothetical protein